MSIFTLAYQSRNLIESLTLDSAAELGRMVSVARSRNADLGITGALLLNEGTFLQILEGEEKHVRDVFGSIERDARHTNIVARPAEFIARRYFEKWSMAFVSMNPAARDYYKTFALTSEFESTKASADRIGMMMQDLVAYENMRE